MAAGLGFKDFVTGEVLTAADVDGYLMQGVWVFASAAARDAAVTSPQEGNFAYLKDTNVTTYYTGSAWANLDTTGMTNPMTTTGDTIYSSSGSTPARLGIGTTGQVLTVAAGVPSWATPAGGGGKILQVVQTTRAVDQSVNTATFTDITSLSVSITPSSASSRVYVIANIGGSYSYMYSTGTDSLSNWRVMRDSTEIIRAQLGAQYWPSSSDKVIYAPTSMSIVDSPATTSAVTYKVQCRGLSANTLAGNLNTADAGPATIIVWEIGA